jgi:hypothetical protein
MLGAATVGVVVLVLVGDVGEDESLPQAAVTSAVAMMRVNAVDAAPLSVLSKGPAVFSNDDRSFLLGVCGSSESKRRTCRWRCR